MLYTGRGKELITLNQAVYRTGQFARRASVTIRTLRFYDQMGLLTPTGHTESGYRLYSDEDLATLQQILALKYLGLSLDEIRQCLDRPPRRLKEMLSRQRRMMVEKRRHLERVVRAIDAAEGRLDAGSFQWSDLTRVIEAMQMEQNKEWVRQYFNEEQSHTMGELVDRSYSESAAQKLAERSAGMEWTEADQARVSAQWNHVAQESNRLAAAGADPGGEEGQALAKLNSDLLFLFTQGDTEIAAGLKQFWTNHNALPKAEQPMADWAEHMAGPGAVFLQKAMAIYQQEQQDGGATG